ncbi:ATP-dependent Clp protease ATP-binding subunit [Candidatus Peregrinibacteria bacterium]|jgi:ATP-dependent Clp protease ATP-binding subunit ClpC|nr:ATP-dependent Clp protease ATP-binding subunit [Candidatus Peregrinibacteria bacterium]MBT3598610.1 ATP-dependent Clp protease ATP-binding subunit [Candidatus Peregrinibacteria bacterium]MBT4367025.1 ATP-dependent Clp protease ATP-binding subunit [Candidatus Peregrinibacteria bacterium]MBT4586130.1 ATP-dependent Clp protease ATP-binding subunit [Candidatus Peregrinibacteria bacterium]MBT6730605.1 ATP-dependent Clp protease ATP-binding subunit [Candidatus Peregrinibacteria bacterium]
MHPFDRFTPNAKLALQIAEQEAKNMKSNYIGTEHLILGLLSIPKSLGFSIFTGAGVTLENVRILLKAMKSQDIEGKEVKHGLSSYLHSVIEQSVITAHKFRHANVGTEHLLHALVSTGSNGATALLEQMQVEPEDLKSHVEEMFGQINQFKQQSGNMEQSLESFFQGLQGAIVGMQGGTGPGMLEPEDAKRRKGDGKSKTPVLDYFTDDLIVRVKEGKTDPVIGRDTEIDRMIHILNRKTKNNPVLIGEPGVGKTAIAEGLAQRIAHGKVPSSLRNKRVLVLNMGSLVAGTKYRGEFEQRFDDIIKEAISCENEILLFIDELHTVVGAGSAEGSLDAANILKPALSRGAIQVIGATTTDEFKTIEKDRALERRFQSILVEEPTMDDTIKILKGIRKGFEEFHRLTISDDALKASVQLSKRYINDRFLPDKAIDVLDEAAAQLSIQQTDESPKLKKLEDALEALIEKQQDAVKDQKYHVALKLKQEQQVLQEKIEEARAAMDGDKRTPLRITEDNIAHVIGNMTGIPVTKILKSENKKLQNLEVLMRKHVVGQDESIKKVARAIRRSRVGIGDQRRPIGSFLFLGPTGVGKTELVRTIAEEVFGKEDALIKIDMSEFMERHNVSRLVGATAGYVGYEDGGQLTEMVRRKPYSVVLFDEIEKAHPEFFNILLQVLEDGVLTDGHGKQVDFRNTVIVMTSNIGAGKLTKEAAKIGFKTLIDSEKEDKAYEEKCEEVISELKENVRPEFLNRVDHVIVFNALHQEHIRKIVNIHIDMLTNRLKEKGYKLEIDQKAVNFLAEKGFDQEYGARPVRRVIQEHVEDEIAEHILKGIFNTGDTICVIKKKDKEALDFMPKEVSKKPKVKKAPPKAKAKAA